MSNFVSTDDALTGLIWQTISRARRSHLDTSTRSLLARTVDLRKAMGVVGMYPGMMQNMAFNNMTVEEGFLICLLARSQLSCEISWILMTLMRRRPQESPILSYLKPFHDVMITPWAKMDCYGDDFNLGLGKPENVLRPAFAARGTGMGKFNA
ncbi:hypothetical protein BDV29DRAFT_155995 [Aspergillus leporis]|jgi:hypothetical protein|uniref:Uncharacterized protein n=1 Tax=Aspergillus leporis TaxID=41062 RepID=A0A5N5X4W4_9EURO|nr:hypothetical protein BDV29DRAFT_155995 [Aspergillus leporis]